MAVFAMMVGFNIMESGSAERKLTSFCSFCWKIHQKNLYLTKNNLYKKPLFSKDHAREPESQSIAYQWHQEEK